MCNYNFDYNGMSSDYTLLPRKSRVIYAGGGAIKPSKTLANVSTDFGCAKKTLK